MSVVEQVLSEVREWVMLTLGITAEDRVIFASRGPTPGPFPGAPCLILDLSTVSSAVGTVESLPLAAGEVILGRRTAGLTITGYGMESADWIEELSLRVDEAPVGFCIAPLGDTIDVSALQETGFEQTYSREFTLYYAVNVTRAATAALNFPVTVSNT